MNFFPVTHSNLSGRHLAVFLQENYSLGDIIECRIIKSGVNDTYLVKSVSGKFVFRIYSLNWRTREEIGEEIKLLEHLKDNGISISYPVTDKNGSCIQTLNAPEGERYAVLFSYAEGEKIHILSPETHFQVGQLMAKMHQLTNKQSLKRISYSPGVLLIDSLNKVSEFLSADSDEMKFMLSAQNFLLNEFMNAKANDIRNGVVHMDIWFDNMNIAPGDKITVFDFDFCGNGWLCLDIAYYILQLHNVEKYEEKDYQPKIDSFMKGYESQIIITNEEKRLIPMLGVSMYFFYLGIQCQRYDNWSNSFLSENYLKRYINGLVKRYYDIYKLG